MPPRQDIVVGNPDEWRAFPERLAAFVEALPRLRRLSERVFIRQFQVENPAQYVVFVLGRLAVEDFLEILLLSGNGYGVAGLKLLRGMFERLVTARYLTLHPDQAEEFLGYHYVHQRRLINHARTADIDLRGKLTDQQVAGIEANYQRVREKYTEVVCANCGSTRDQFSWTKRDLRTMAEEVGLGRMYVSGYFWPTLQYHTTVSAMELRLTETERGISFKEGPQRQEADYAVMEAHLSLALMIETHNTFFQLGLDREIEQMRADIERCWPV